MANTSNNDEHVKTLIKKAAEATLAHEAMQFAQAACNAASALCALRNVLPK